jgi:hypothetical protein
LNKINYWSTLEEETGETRRKSANWEFIESLPKKLKASLIYYIETGDIRA